MAAARLAMRTTHEILRLNWACGLTHRQIARSRGVARGTVAERLRCSTAPGLTWPLPAEAELDTAALEARLYPPPPPPSWPAPSPPGPTSTRNSAGPG